MNFNLKYSYKDIIKHRNSPQSYNKWRLFSAFLLRKIINFKLAKESLIEKTLGNFETYCIIVGGKVLRQMKGDKVSPEHIFVTVIIYCTTMEPIRILSQQFLISKS